MPFSDALFFCLLMLPLRLPLLLPTLLSSLLPSLLPFLLMLPLLLLMLPHSKISDLATVKTPFSDSLQDAYTKVHNELAAAIFVLCACCF